MKKQILRAVAYSVLSVSVLMSCTKKDDDATPSASFSYSANGTNNSAVTLAQLPASIIQTQDYSSVSIDSQKGSLFGVTVPATGVVVVGAANLKAVNDTAIVYIVCAGLTKTGSYPISSTAIPSISVKYTRTTETGKIPVNVTPTVTGTVNITAYDVLNKKVSGTFSFTQTVAKDGTGANVTSKIENGQFVNVPLQSF